MEGKKKTMTADEALQRASSYCSRAERSIKEVRDKLKSWGVESDEDAEHIVDWLISERFVDSERFAHAYVHDKMEYDGWGRIKIAAGLRQKGIGETLAHDAIAAAFDEEKYREQLAQLMRSKLARMPRPLSPQNKAKLYRLAMSRGYESDVASSVLCDVLHTCEPPAE